MISLPNESLNTIDMHAFLFPYSNLIHFRNTL